MIRERRYIYADTRRSESVTPQSEPARFLTIGNTWHVHQQQNPEGEAQR